MTLCPRCGSELKEGTRFCASCGFQVISMQQGSNPSQSPESQSSYQLQQPVSDQAKRASDAFADAISGKTNLVQRALNIITNPKQEWEVINSERPETIKLIAGYALILAMIPAIASFLAYGMIGISFFGSTYRNISSGLLQGISQLLAAVIGVYLLAWVIDLIAPSFESEKNMGKSLQLAVYSSTAQWVAGIFLLIPGLRWLSILGGLYAIYLLATGLPVLKKTPQDKVTSYVVVTILAMLVIGFVLALIFVTTLGVFFTGSRELNSLGL